MDHATEKHAAFTLIELLVVIALLLLLMAVLLPAVLQARAMIAARTEAQFVQTLSLACKMYAEDFGDQAPAVVADPLNTGLSPARISGAQNLRLALLGCARDGNALVQKNSGVADDLTKYSTSSRKVYVPGIRPDQLLRHGDLTRRNADGTDPDIEVFVDGHFSPARPLLYYRTANSAFRFADNAAYMAGPTEIEANWARWAEKARKIREPFFIIWSGPDREFFTDDDRTNMPND
ncbi:MAG: prepilin-type N-terminal cleavage/methylation domain-containing protein [Phycisphaerae bacterium]|nr:prepilin-type N-terminal cleavage/methylation domain-containing protein [Phycisphaerae bacterium]